MGRPFAHSRLDRTDARNPAQNLVREAPGQALGREIRRVMESDDVIVYFSEVFVTADYFECSGNWAPTLPTNRYDMLATRRFRKGQKVPASGFELALRPALLQISNVSVRHLVAFWEATGC
jgi:hypothetical protein